MRRSAIVGSMLALGVACGGEKTESAEREDVNPAASAVASAVAATEEAVEDATRSANQAVANAEAEAREPCTVPAIPIPRPRECVRGRSYPQCKWQMPHATLSEGRYRRWRNTIMEHWWGRPGLVSFVVASTARYRERFPDQVLAVGDLDAPGPRHQTHDNGVDVDIYLPGAMLVENAGGGDYVDNHEGKSAAEVEQIRTRVEGLARVLAECADGAVRIYYNDPVVLERFHEWYDAQGFAPNPFGRPMQQHNRLHDFHFHITVPEDLAVRPMAPLPPGIAHPIQRIEEPPDPESAPNLASRNRNTTWREEQEALDEEDDAPEPVPPSAMSAMAMDPTPMSATPMSATPMSATPMSATPMSGSPTSGARARPGPHPASMGIVPPDERPEPAASAPPR